LTEERLGHIAARHPEFNDPVDRIGLTVASPHLVTRDRRIARAECYYRKLGDRVMTRVVVIFRPTPAGWVGDVLTAHPVEHSQKGEQPLWP
jgi:hypothetical protein